MSVEEGSKALSQEGLASSFVFFTFVSALLGPLQLIMNLRISFRASSRNQLGFEVMVTLLGYLERADSALEIDCSSVGTNISQQ